MIYTVTFNPSIDYIMKVDTFQEGGLNRAKETYKFAGGKGINVSRVLNTLETPSTALGFVGGFPGKFIQDALQQAGIKNDFIEVEEDTRINVKLKSGQETEINAGGPTISNQAFEALLTQIKNTNADDTVVVAGSVPKSIPDNAYEQIAKITQKTGAKLVVDAEKDLVETVLPYNPFFIKPNKDELEVMFDTNITSDNDVVTHGKAILDKGAQAVIVSLGGEGAIYIDAEHCIKASVPQGNVLNTVGSGDSTVAGMLAGLAQGFDVHEAFRNAVASGTATAFSQDLANKEMIEKVRSEIELTDLK
ncbi:1-phosphofructokinase [Staphylococcus simulans]|uniref:1-phosphofructokinase n=1 Tax=Staphylococcus simulans TaxID=1286 RepID=UPI0021D21408|nr:1-phosphofructokinase [Staphylococcus simulans]MDQ7113701.1 1-phosphofructokinase [Staphylococcus simulans]MDQ7117016.1 1-phosphofructokinase [Staphylococcus simulans]UXR29998.1 1-phosphofructokinase [Staphylococcus simulans]WMM11468.1 1-phosphofructokinase [Staphylococcus simulans]